MTDRINEKYPDRSTPSAIRSIRIIKQLVPEIAGMTGVVINMPTIEPQSEVLDGEVYRPELVTESVSILSRAEISEPSSFISLTNPQIIKTPVKVPGSMSGKDDATNIVKFTKRPSGHPLSLLEKRKWQLGQTTVKEKAA